MDDDRVFKALADATRRHLLDRLFERDGRTLTELESELEMSRFGVMKHLRVLEEAGLVQRERDGRVSRCELDAAPMRDAAEWLGRYRAFWGGRLDALARYLERPDAPAGRTQLPR
jgi:DNA-binding transcriptional ArsR family regulator